MGKLGVVFVSVQFDLCLVDLLFHLRHLQLAISELFLLFLSLQLLLLLCSLASSRVAAVRLQEIVLGRG